jgi:hypothetical protein
MPQVVGRIERLIDDAGSLGRFTRLSWICRVGLDYFDVGWHEVGAHSVSIHRPHGAALAA